MRGAQVVACSLVLIASLGVCSPAMAQGGSTTATLRGTIEDPSGAALPAVLVTVSDVRTRASQRTTTDLRGSFSFIGLSPSTYDFSADISGFKTYRQTTIVLGAGDARGLDVRMELGLRTETVTVTSPSEIIQTDRGAREARLTPAQIETLSTVGRSPLELLRILPGVVAPESAGLEVVHFGSPELYTVNGVRSSTNTVSLDGSSITDIGCNCGQMLSLNNDMVQEVNVQSSNFAAEYGAGGMAISAVTKSGRAKFSGTLYDYGRNYRLAANDRSNSILGLPKPKSAFQYPGGNVGGPVVFGDRYTRNRDRLFFFVGLESQRQELDPGATLGVVPTVKQRAGDFSEFLSPDGQSLNQLGAVAIPQGFAGQGTPAPGANLAPYITPLGSVLLNAYPAPTGSYQDNRYNYVLSQLQPLNRLEMKARIDWNVTRNTRAYIRLARDSEDTENPRGVWWGASDVALPSPGIGTDVGKSLSGNVFSVLSPTTTNELLVSLSRLKLDNRFKDPSKMRLDHYGVDFVGSFPGESPYIPAAVGGYGQVSSLWAGAADVYAHNDELTFSDKLTRVLGAHGLKFGASIQRLQKQQNEQNEEEGTLLFAPWTAGGTGSVFGDVLSGRINQMNQGTRIPDGKFRMWNVDAFAQDSWKLRPNLTFEYGVRAGYWTNNRELNGLGGYFDPSSYDPTRGLYLDPGTFRLLNGECYVYTGCAPAGMLPNRSPFAMPRLNVAWDINGDGRNVLSGGYGLFFNRNMGNVEYNTALSLPPAAHYAVTTADDGANYGNGLGLTYDTAHEATLANRLGSSNVSTLVPSSFKFPKTHSFSVSYARRIFFGQVAEASYVGTRGRDLVSNINGNVVPQGALLQGVVGNADLGDPIERLALDTSVVNGFRPFPSYGVITNEDFEGVSNYNSLQVTLSRQTGRRLQYFVAYTLSRTLGSPGEYQLRDPFDASRTYGIDSADRTHILNLSWNAFLPDGARGAMDNAFGRGLLNGWQLSGISTFASGTPIHLVFTGPAGEAGVAQAYYGTPDHVVLSGLYGTPQGGLSPVYTCDPRLSGSKVGEKILDINCISVPAFGQIGQTIPPYDLRTQSRTNQDLTLFKNFVLRGQQKLQLRFGFFNLFNTAYANQNYGDVNLNLSTECNRYVDHVPNGVGGDVDQVCDPSAGFHFTQDAIDNFGRITLLRGHRVVELAVKYYF